MGWHANEKDRNAKEKKRIESKRSQQLRWHSSYEMSRTISEIHFSPFSSNKKKDVKYWNLIYFTFMNWQSCSIFCCCFPKKEQKTATSIKNMFVQWFVLCYFWHQLLFIPFALAFINRCKFEYSHKAQSSAQTKYTPGFKLPLWIYNK